MIIWLRHSLHGVKPCYSESEARLDLANGWERFDPDAVVAPKDEAAAHPEIAIPQVERKKPGPKPKVKV